MTPTGRAAAANLVCRLRDQVSTRIVIEWSATRLSIRDIGTSTPDLVADFAADSSDHVLERTLFTILDYVQDAMAESTQLEWPLVDGVGGYEPYVERFPGGGFQAGYRRDIDVAWSTIVPLKSPTK